MQYKIIQTWNVQVGVELSVKQQTRTVIEV